MGHVGVEAATKFLSEEEQYVRVIALEEHFTAPGIAGQIDREAISRRGIMPRLVVPEGQNPAELAPDLGAGRLRLMDESGITMQVLSNTGPGPDLVPGTSGVAMARAMNDYLAEAVARHPDRFAGFAVLPMCSPDETTVELTRAVKDLGFVGALVNGTTEARFLDDECYDGLLAQAAVLDVPIYIHPHLAPEAVRQAYFSGLEQGASRILETAGWGWHAETALHVLRLVLSGALDRHRSLKLIIGHMGEMLPMMLARADDYIERAIDHLQRPVRQTILDQVWITTSGIFTEPPFLAALLTFGIDRIMFSVDYPYSSNANGRAFLDRISLSPADMAKLTHGNAESLLRLNR
jgi:predicted TIM-barrel fold metal-dependent hydrolase